MRLKKKTVAALVLSAGLASGALAGGRAVPAAGGGSPAGTASVASVTSARLLAARPAGWPVLRQGANSTWPKVTVRSLQYLLDAHGAKLAADGVFGAGTRTALVAFQRARHLTVDGVTGPQTWSALIVTVRLGSTGYAVRALQDQADYRAAKFGAAKFGLSLTVDGVFGPQTRIAVRAFQASAGLATDGVAGQLTWQALVNEVE